jgi:hypothetical protein
VPQFDLSQLFSQGSDSTSERASANVPDRQEFAVDVPVTGMNAALRRPVKCDTFSIPLLERAGYVPSWRPYWPKVKTIGLTFPEGMTFLPPKEEKEETRRVAPPKPTAEAHAHQAPQRRPLP